MTSLQQWGGVLALVAIVLAIGAYAYPKARAAGAFGSATNCTDGYTCVTNLETQGNQIVDGTTSLVGAVTTTGTTTAGNLNITTTNTATSSIQVGCIQTTATSTATPVKIMLGSLNSQASTTFTSATVAGFAVWGFGKCPGV